MNWAVSFRLYKQTTLLGEPCGELNGNNARANEDRSVVFLTIEKKALTMQMIYRSRAEVYDHRPRWFKWILYES